MEGRWRWSRLSRRTAVFTVALLLRHLVTRCYCLSLNSEGLALLRFRERLVRDPFGALSNWNRRDVEDPCSWFGVECSGGKVVILNLRDLCLEGSLGPELGKLGHIQSLVLRDNSLSGDIPNEIGELKELEVLDLGCNNFSGAFPSSFVENFSLTTLLLDNNKFLGSVSPELSELKMLSEFQVDENQLTCTNTARRASCSSEAITWNTVQARKLQDADTPNPSEAKLTKDHGRGSRTSITEPFSSMAPTDPPSSPLTSPMPSSELPFASPFFASPPPIESMRPSPPSPSPVEASTPSTPSPKSTRAPTLSPSSNPTHMKNKHSNSKVHKILILAGVLGGVSIILISAICFFFLRSTKVDTIKPWATSLSGQLQSAFPSGVPELNRSELEAACEDFSNIIGSCSDATIYKGTLSSGVEIAVASSVVTSRRDWSKSLESQFREKISTLSKVKHENFMNLVGYCEEEQPFTRMMVFEYAPNGTLFEHLHVAEAEHLDWRTRLRIAMGIAYCLEHMHQLTPPVTHRNLQSSSIYLTEDYAAKISDFSFHSDLGSKKRLEAHSVCQEDNVHSFGVILFEMLTGKNPSMVDTSSLADWIQNYWMSKKSLVEIVDPALTSFQEDKLEKLVGVIDDCVDSDLNQRPKMKEITERLKEITAMGPDGTGSRRSPLWWAELEIVSTDES